MKFHQGVRLIFFGRPELQVNGPSDVGVVIIELAHFLSKAEGELPDFGAVVGNETGEDKLHDGFVGGPIDFFVERRGDVVETEENALADGFEVGGFVGRGAGFGLGIRGQHIGAEVREFFIEAGNLHFGRWREPIDGAE